MRLTSIRAKNFKSFKELDIRLDNLNVLIGANASGKSNFVQLFAFVRDIVVSGLENAISIQGGAKYLRNLNCGEDDPLTIELSIEHDSNDPVPFLLESGPSRVIRSWYRFSLTFRGGRGVVAEDELKLQRSSESQSSPGDVTVKRVNGRYDTEGNTGLVGPMWPSSIQEDVRHPELLIEHQGLRALLPSLNGLRSIEAYDIASKEPKTAVLFGGKRELEPDGHNLAIVLEQILSDNEERRTLMNLLKDALPFINGLDIEALSDRSLFFHLRERFSQEPVPAAFLSDGTVDVIALIVILYFERKSLVIIEEVERNLHPSMMSSVVAYLEDASHRKQIIITTHSPEIVRHTDPGHLILISRDSHGYSRAERPVDRAGVQQFLRDEISMHELYVQDLLEV